MGWASSAERKSGRDRPGSKGQIMTTGWPQRGRHSETNEVVAATWPAAGQKLVRGWPQSLVTHYESSLRPLMGRIWTAWRSRSGHERLVAPHEERMCLYPDVS